MKPVISVIIPTFNREKFLKNTVQSVVDQTFDTFELLIIDDGSTDSTKEVINSLNDKRITYIYQTNQGPSSARNTGIKIAKSPFIAFLDSDDSWKKDKLEIQYNAMLDNPQYLLSHTEEIWYKNGKVLNPKKIHQKQHGDIFEQSLMLCAISISTVMVNKELFDKIGLFDENLLACEDYDMWLRFTAHFPVLLIKNVLTIKQGGHRDQLSKKFLGMDKFRIYAIEKLINNSKSSLVKKNIELAVKELKRKCVIYGKGCLKHNKNKEGELYLELSNKY